MTEETIFSGALQRTNSTERQAFLALACAGDARLQERVEALLRAHTEAASFLDVPAVAQVAAGDATEALDVERQVDAARPDTQPRVPDGNGDALAFLSPSQKRGSLGRLDHYEVKEVVGNGGMGVVVKAFDEKLHRVVAIKALAPALASNGTARKRFVREAQAAAAVSHDHVVAIHAVEDAGAIPYLVMHFVSGISLEDRIKQGGPLELTEILRIGLQTAQGLAAAHAQGLVHRDVKPGNILLENGIQRVKITDFGLARAVDDASLTQSGVIAGTPMYMSPEQARGETVDHRSDLFSLGSVLYALCTGRAPFRASGTMAVLKRVCDESPRPIAEVNPAIPAWLAAIIDKLHAKDPAERFQSAAEVADLLSRHLAHLQQPQLMALPPPVGHVSNVPPQQRHVGNVPHRRNRRRVLAMAALLFLVAGAVTVIALLCSDHRRDVPDEPVVPSDAAFDALKREAIPPALLALAGGGDPAKAPAEVVAVLGDASRQGRVECVATSPDGKLVASAGEDRIVRVWNLAEWQAGVPLPPVRTLEGHADAITALAFSPSGKVLASASRDLTVVVWDLVSGQERVLSGIANPTMRLAFSPDGRALAMGCQDGGVRLWDVAGGNREGTLLCKQANALRCVAYSPDGKLLACGGQDGQVWVTDAATGRRLKMLVLSRPVNNVAFARDGKTLAAVAERPETHVHLWNVADWTLTRVSHLDEVHGLQFSPAAPLLATTTSDGTVRIWDLSDHPYGLAFKPCVMGEPCIAFSPRGGYLIAGGNNGLVSILRAPSAADAQARRRQQQQAFDAWAKASRDQKTRRKKTPDAGDPGGQAFEEAPAEPALLVGLAGTLAPWGGISEVVASVQPIFLTAKGVRDGPAYGLTGFFTRQFRFQAKEGYAVGGIVFRSGAAYDGFKIIFMRIDGPRLDAEDRYETEYIGNGPSLTTWGGDGKPVIGIHGRVGGRDPYLRGIGLVQLEVEQELPPRAAWQAHHRFITALEFTRDGMLISASKDGFVKRWRPQAGKEPDATVAPLASVAAQEDGVRALAASADGTTVATAGFDRIIRLWDAQGNPLHEISGLSNGTSALLFHGDRSQLLIAGVDGKVRLIEALRGAGEPKQVLDVSDAAITQLSALPNHKILAVSSSDATVRLWALDPAKAIRSVPEAVTACFSLGGTKFAVATAAGPIEVRDAAKLDVLVRLRGHVDPALALRFSTDGNRLLSCDKDGRLYVWDTSRGYRVAILRGGDGRPGCIALSADGQTAAAGSEDGKLYLWDLSGLAPN